MTPQGVRLSANGWPVAPFFHSERLVSEWLTGSQKMRAAVGAPASDDEREDFIALGAVPSKEQS